MAPSTLNQAHVLSYLATAIVVWEYQIKNVGDTSFAEEMNLQGELGWDLVFARRAKDSGDTFGYECIFKRVKK